MSGFQFGFGSALTSFLLSCIIFLHYANFKFLRCDRVTYLTLTGLLPSTLVSLVSGYMLWGASQATLDFLVPITVVLLFALGAVPACVTPYVYKPLFQGVMSHPMYLSVLSTMLTMVVAYLVLNIITPAFLTGDTTTRVIIRLIVFPLLIELPAGAGRLVARYWMGEHYPMDRILISLVGPLVGSSLMGRFLATNMETVWETVGLSIALSVVELLMRSTMLWRDDLYIQCCGRPCGGKKVGVPAHAAVYSHPSLAPRTCTAGQEEGAQSRDQGMGHVHVVRCVARALSCRRHAHTLPSPTPSSPAPPAETIFEDAGILLSLPVSLVFRVPPTPGAAPLSVADLITRVLIQMFIEMFTDIGYAVAYWGMVRIMGVRYGAVTMTEMRIRRRSTMLRVTETRRYLFLPRPMRSISRALNFSKSTLDHTTLSTADDLSAAGGPAATGTSTVSTVSSGPDGTPSSPPPFTVVPDLDTGADTGAARGTSWGEGSYKAASTPTGKSKVTPSSRQAASSFIDDAVPHPSGAATPQREPSSADHADHKSMSPSSDTPLPPAQLMPSPATSPAAGGRPGRIASTASSEATSMASQPGRLGTDLTPGDPHVRQGTPMAADASAGALPQAPKVGPISVAAPGSPPRPVTLTIPAGADSDGGSLPGSPHPVSARRVQEVEDVSDIAHVKDNFWSCSPCCLRPDTAIVRRNRAALVQELRRERVSEQEFIWEPIALGLIAYQSGRSRRDLQTGPGAEAQWTHVRAMEAPTSPTAATDVYGKEAFAGGMNASAYEVTLKAAPAPASGAQSPGAPSMELPPRPPLHHSTKSQVEAGKRERQVREQVEQAVAMGTEPSAGLEDEFSPPLLTLIAMRMELVALRFLRGWETRFKFWNLTIALAMLGGALYTLRTMNGNFLCPVGEPDRPDDWVFDFCVNLRD